MVHFKEGVALKTRSMRKRTNTARKLAKRDCERMNRATLQWLSNSLTPWLIDSAVGDMKLNSQTGPQLATYVRYNVSSSRRG